MPHGPASSSPIMFSRESRALMKHPPPLTTTTAGQSNETSVEAGHDTQIIPQSPGPLQVRSTKGCWTCRLRKKSNSKSFFLAIDFKRLTSPVSRMR